jgi:DNA-binding GntR family transcriptional regulator
MSRQETETCMTSFIAITNHDGRYQWAVGEQPNSGAYMHASQDTEHSDEVAGCSYSTAEAAYAAAKTHIWESRPDLVRMAQNEAEEGLRYRKMMNRA